VAPLAKSYPGAGLKRRMVTELVIGHEMFGKVASVGSSVTRVKPGDYAMFTVRRGCGECASRIMNRADMCQTGKVP